MDFTKAEIEFIRDCTKSTIINEETRLEQRNMSSDSATWTRERIKMARGLLAKLEEKDGPITASWLESLGIPSQNIEDECERFTARYGLRGLSKIHVDFYFNSSRVEVWIQVRSGSFNGEILQHIQTRQQLTELYGPLAGRELGK